MTAMHGWPMAPSGLREEIVGTQGGPSALSSLFLPHRPIPPRTQHSGFTWPWVAYKDSLSDLSVTFNSLSGTQLIGTISSAEWNAPHLPE